MLNQYRRHTKKCTKRYKQHDRKHNNCKCIVYVEGKLTRSSEYIKASTGTRSWEEARKMIVAAEQRGYWTTASESHDSASEQETRHFGQSVASAVDAFLLEAGSEKGRNLAPATHSKYRTVLGRLKQFSASRGITELDQLTVAGLLAFKQTWNTGPRATVNNIQRLRSFFSFCLNLRWIDENPAQGLKMPRGIKSTQKIPFTEDEMNRIVRAAQIVTLDKQQAVGNADLYAFILAMRYTGLRISDCGLLKSSRLQEDHILLYAKKNGALVYCPLLPWVANALRSVTVKPGGFLFCTGSTRLETVVEVWSKRLRKVFKAAGIKNGTSHRFRHYADIRTMPTEINYSRQTTAMRCVGPSGPDLDSA